MFDWPKRNKGRQLLLKSMQTNIKFAMDGGQSPPKLKKRKLNDLEQSPSKNQEKDVKVPRMSTEVKLLSDDGLHGLLDDMDFDCDDFGVQSQDSAIGISSSDTSAPITLPTDYTVDVDNGDMFADDFCFDEEFSGEVPVEIEYKLNLTSWKRCIVTSIERDRVHFDMVLIIRQHVENGQLAKCRLQGPWSSTKVALDDLVSVIAEWNDQCQCYCVSLHTGFIILCPDALISGTTVTNAVFCTRKAVFTDRYTGIDSNNKIMFIGSLVHELFQAVIASRPILTTVHQVQTLVDRMITSSDMLAQLYETSMDMDELKTELAKFVPKIVGFVARYITGDDSRLGQKEEFAGKIDKILDIEENIWVPAIGLKGKVDVTVKIRRRNKFANSEVELMPLEVKTGKSSFSSEHRGQVSIYQMMMKETGRNVKSGLLLYLRDGVMKEIVVSRNDQRDLIMLRNEVAYHTTRNDQSIEFRESFKMFAERMDTFGIPVLPEPISHHSACEKCPYNMICCAFLSRDSEVKLSAKHPLRRVMETVLEHLLPSHVDYFIHWSGLLALEEKSNRSENDLKSMWMDTPEQREKRGHAIINLSVVGQVLEEFNTFVHTFQKKKAKQDEEAHDFTVSGIAVGDYLRVSTDVRVAVAAGRVTQMNSSSITMSLERNLSKTYPNETFILDNIDSQSMTRMNLANLGALLDNSEHRIHLRSIVVDRIEATFKNQVPRSFAQVARTKLSHLNNIQQRAVIRSITATDYMLIKGLPGTGKTQTLTSIIQMFMVLGKSVLITSHTHSAVDNVLMRLLSDKLRFMRLGEPSRVATAIRPFCASTLTKNCKTPDDIRAVYDSYPIVGVTCLGANHPMLSQRFFDVCLVDESTQVLQTTIMRPLFAARKFILVGDPDQLPPIVRSAEARSLGADESLFKRLDSPEATIVLTKQYRMNQTITKLANDLTYGGSLVCGSETVATATLHIPHAVKISESFPTEVWLQNVLSTHIDKSIILIDTGNVFERSVAFQKSVKSTSALPANVTDKATRIYKNYCEAAVTTYLIKVLILSSVNPETVGVIAPYVAQVQLLSKALRILEHQSGLTSSFEVNTVDQYQGRDKEIIILSCTKTNNPKVSNGKREFEILEDFRRLTVAITRSKHKLIILGDVQSLLSYTPFTKLISSISPAGKKHLTDGEDGFSWTNVMEHLFTVFNGPEN